MVTKVLHASWIATTLSKGFSKAGKWTPIPWEKAQKWGMKTPFVWVNQEGILKRIHVEDFIGYMNNNGHSYSLVLEKKGSVSPQYISVGDFALENPLLSVES